MQPPVVTVCESAGDIVVDGVIDEASWMACPPVVDFLRYQPSPGGSPPGSTEVRIAQDERGLYVSVVVRDAGYPIRARIAPREFINSDDQVGVYLDTFRTGRTGYVFYTNPKGVQQDIRATGSPQWNFNWNTVWEAEGTVSGHGYTIEEFFPWRSLKYPAGADTQTWGLVLTRKIPSEGYKYAFPSVTRNHPRFLSQGAALTGLRPGPNGSGLELIPGVAAAQTWPTESGSFTDFGRPLDVVHPSLDARYGITPDLSVAATLWPDFSQVESDSADIRLNPQYAFRYPETRPFFLDAVEHFQDPSTLLYTRSIQSPIEGLKLSGRAGGVGVGALQALDLDPQPSVHVDETKGFAESDMEGRIASSAMARTTVDAFDGGFVGLTLGDKRVLGTADAPGAAGVWDGVSLDANVPLGERTTLLGWTHQAAWNTADTPLVWGQEVAASIVRSSGNGTGASLTAGDTTPGLRKEMGFHTVSGYSYASGLIDHSFNPGGGVDEWLPRVRASVSRERSGEAYAKATAGQELTSGVTTVDFEGGVAWVREQGLVGPDVRVDPDVAVEVLGPTASAWIDTELGSALELYANASGVRTVDYSTLDPTWAGNGSLTATLRPTPWLRIALTPSGEVNNPDSSELEFAYALRTKVETQFTRAWGLRLIAEPVDGNTIDSTVSLSGLVTWLKVPGTAFYAGFSEILAGPGKFETAERIAFAKATVLIRP